MLDDNSVDVFGFFFVVLIIGVILLIVSYCKVKWKSWVILISGLWFIYSIWGYVFMGLMCMLEIVFNVM